MLWDPSDASATPSQSLVALGADPVHTNMRWLSIYYELSSSARPKLTSTALRCTFVCLSFFLINFGV